MIVYLTKQRNPEIADKTELKRATQLQQGDEILACYKRKAIRCAIARRPEVSAVSINLFIVPVRSRVNPERDLRQIRFEHETQIPVFSHKTPKVIKSSAAEKEVMNVLSPGAPLRSVAKIRGLITMSNCPVKFSIQDIKEACIRLARKKVITFRFGAHNSYMYRAPIAEGTEGLLVVENPKTQSERYGWVDGFERHRQLGTLPVVQFLDGQRVFSRDDVLEPLDRDDISNAYMVKRLEIAQQLSRGIKPERYVQLPIEMLTKLQCTNDPSCCYQLYKELLGFIGYGHEGVHRNRVPSAAELWLDTYYPGWQSGKLAFPLEHQQDAAIAA